MFSEIKQKFSLKKQNTCLAYTILQNKRKQIQNEIKTNATFINRDNQILIQNDGNRKSAYYSKDDLEDNDKAQNLTESGG